MTTTTFAEVLSLAKTLSPYEQSALIEALSESQNSATTPQLPASIRRSKPIDNLQSLIAPFVPAEESADDIIDFVHS